MRILMMLLWLSAVLLVTASYATAEQITYNIVDYPLAEIDGGGYQDKVSGTITASTTGPLGFYTAGSFTPPSDPSAVNLAYTITIQSSNPTLPIPSVTYSNSGPLSDYLGSGTVTFTSTSILLGGYMALSSSPTDLSGLYTLYWRPDIDSYFGRVIPAGYLSGPEFMFSENPAIHLDPAPWIIATVPEPSTMVLACLATAGLTVPLLRRRRKR